MFHQVRTDGLLGGISTVITPFGGERLLFYLLEVSAPRRVKREAVYLSRLRFPDEGM
ncbi:hypothetical protein XFF6991_180294 [Xanthomonas phaseoli pv. phaseoli]|uniref:Uncharacterized protein n=1 Tax=Xanthomonas campestris pv. phaseoli TaxID=317013 RepID=A0A7Z7IZP4_XANCH|nr:hypothetical protein XFF6991_180294 [Xanthomonas phaseoli pv. phaseoli]